MRKKKSQYCGKNKSNNSLRKRKKKKVEKKKCYILTKDLIFQEETYNITKKKIHFQRKIFTIFPEVITL